MSMIQQTTPQPYRNIWSSWWKCQRQIEQGICGAVSSPTASWTCWNSEGTLIRYCSVSDVSTDYLRWSHQTAPDGHIYQQSAGPTGLLISAQTIPPIHGDSWLKRWAQRWGTETNDNVIKTHKIIRFHRSLTSEGTISTTSTETNCWSSLPEQILMDSCTLSLKQKGTVNDTPDQPFLCYNVITTHFSSSIINSSK